jgi:adenosine deaminase
VAFDLAGGEAGRPAGQHRAAFDVAASGLLGITVHAGEAAGAESVADAVYACRANRIGHGTRLFEDATLQDYVRDRRILIEANITSNVQTRAVARASEHPVRGYFDAGLSVTLCTDGWLMAGVSLSDEYWLAHTELGFTRQEIDQLIVNGFAGAFLPWPERLELLSRVRDELADIRVVHSFAASQILVHPNPSPEERKVWDRVPSREHPLPLYPLLLHRSLQAPQLANLPRSSGGNEQPPSSSLAREACNSRRI